MGLLTEGSPLHCGMLFTDVLELGRLVPTIAHDGLLGLVGCSIRHGYTTAGRHGGQYGAALC
jgi:hypothetical protein